MSWTEKRVQQLETLWRAGKSASEIAGVLGDVTRNAVIGKAHRMGLSGRPSPIKKKKKEAVAAPVKPAAAKPPSTMTSKERQASTKRSRAAAVAASGGKSDGGVSIMQLTERMCKWPFGDPRDANFHFCGKASTPGIPYCDEHVAVAYQSGGRGRNTEKTAEKTADSEAA